MSALDQELTGAVLRFLRSIETGADRRVLALMYLKEMVYRVLQREQYARLLAIAATEAATTLSRRFSSICGSIWLNH